MICLHCGYCCLKLFVPVIIDIDKEMCGEDNVLVLTGDRTRCPHLKGDKPGEYFCAIHEHDKFKLTPCYAYTQIENGNTPCRIGTYTMEREKMRKSSADWPQHCIVGGLNQSNDDEQIENSDKYYNMNAEQDMLYSLYETNSIDENDI